MDLVKSYRNNKNLKIKKIKIVKLNVLLFFFCILLCLSGGDSITIFEKGIDRTNSYNLKDIEKGEIIPLVSDAMFHTMFNKKHKKYVAYFISLVLEKDYNQILNSITFLNNELDKDGAKRPKRSVDLVCEVDEEIINIEMNNNMTIPSLERNIDYANQLYKSKNEVGKSYQYNKVIQIDINNFSFIGEDKTIDKFYLLNSREEKLTEKFEYIYIFLPKIRNKYYNKEKLNDLEKLLLIFNERESKELNSLYKGNKIMEEYRDEGKKMSMSEAIRLDTDWDALHKADLEYERKFWREKGIEEGKLEGIEEGRQEYKKEMIIQMIINEIDIETIAKCSGLSVEEINKIKEDNNL